MSRQRTYLDLVNEVDSFPSPTLSPIQHAERTSNLHLFTAGSHTLGYVLPSVVAALQEANEPHWTITPTSISIEGDTVEKRSKNMAATLERWRANGKFQVCSKGWRNELYSVYSPTGVLYLRMERSGTPLFGLVHMTAYVPATETQPLRIWTPRRNITKSTYGGMLDNTVAGGISSGMSVFDTLVKESEEEASLPAELVSKAKAVGVVSYLYVRDSRAGGETGLLQPEVQYVYDLEVGEDVVPAPCDDEVQDFHLMPLDEVKEELAKGSFKPNCAYVLIDFFVRHGIITPANEPNYIEIVSRLHRELEFPLRAE
ncbi:NUDIX hydrolase domain-like protein [Sphaerosporella brunnea]|uniref:NUDIX hydrolase domain-like protein n=1 Tax=Sphaerosporella brunnea TaxID=1250544 RepID=A0A5J5EQV3_9PEZI|nr:NUDIX hydrolase domain-like protein [Sphaerosporella brunnea]